MIFINTGISQPLILQKSIPDQPVNFRTLEKSYFDWLWQEDNANKNRWKYYSRWIYENARRTDGQGNPGDQNILFREAIKVQQAKKSRGLNKSSTSNWLPLGPEYLPITTKDFIISGKGRINTISFHPTDSMTYFVGTSQGGVWKTVDDGDNWFPLTDNLPILRISDIAINPHDPDEIYISVGDMAYAGIALELDDRKRNTHYGLGIYKTIDGGQSWFPTGLTFEQFEKDFSLARRVIIHKDSTQNLIAAGFFGIYYSEDGGVNWSEKYDQMIWDIEQDPVNPDILFASTAYVRTLDRDQAGIIKSEDFGQTWEPVDLGLLLVPDIQRIELAISDTDPNYVYGLACNLNGGLYAVIRSIDGGNNWETRSTEPNILHWADGTNEGGQGAYDLAIVVDPNDKEKIHIGGVNVWTSADGGSTWSPVSYYTNDYGTSIHADQHFLCFHPASKDIYICNDGGVFRTSEILPGSWTEALNDVEYNWPTYWEQITGGVVNTSFYRLSSSSFDPNHVYAGAQDLGTFYNQSGTWEYNLFGDGMECIISPDDDQIIYGSTQYGNISKSINGGKNFTGIISGIPLWSSEFPEWTTPFMLSPANPEILLVAMSNVWISTDAGDTFKPLAQIPNTLPSSAMAVSPADPNVIYVAKRILHSESRPTEVYRLSSDFLKWNKRDQGLPDSLYLTYMTVDEEDPDLLWASFGGFVDGVKVYRSDNGGMNWINISANLPNVPVNCIIQQPNVDLNPLYVGTDIGVYYTHEGMDRWELYSDGLPNVIVTELEINETHQKIIASTFGRGIWINDLAEEFSTSTERTSLDKIKLDIYPNPLVSNQIINVDIRDNDLNNLQLEIRDVMGRRIYQELIDTPGSHHIKQLALPYPAGLYYLIIKNGSSQISKRIIVQQ